MKSIYKLLSAPEWRRAQVAGVFTGSAVDHADGYIHFSEADQLPETARRHFRGQSDLVCLEIDPARLGGALRWEPSRGGALFPHLYGVLALTAVRRSWPVALGADDIPAIDLTAS